MNHLYNSSNITVRKMNHEDISFICKAGHDESVENKIYLKRQLINQENRNCIALLALYNNEIAGYVFLYYKCKWGSLANCNIPGIVDLIVFERYRKKRNRNCINGYC